MKRAFLIAVCVSLVVGCASPAALNVRNTATQPAPGRMPEISGVDHRGTEFSLDAALAKGPVVVIFYRGHW